MQIMIGKMARMFPMLILIGLAIVITSLAIGIFNAQTAAAYFSESKAVRETSLLAQRAALESTGIWLPTFKFLGLGLILGGIVMALRLIIDRLRQAGEEVLVNLPPEHRPDLPQPPWFGLLMPMVMFIGELILIWSFAVGLRTAAVARDVFANPLPVIDSAGAGSPLLTGLQQIHATESWLVPLKFLGIGTEFLAIIMGLATIIFILTRQTAVIDQAIEIGRTLNQTEAVPALAEAAG